MLKSISSSDSGVENSNSSPSWNKRLNPRFAQVEQPLPQRRGHGSASACFFLRPARLLRSGIGRHGFRVQQRKNYLHPAPSPSRENALGNLVHRVFLHLLAAFRAVGPADAGIQQAQVIVDFGCRGYGRARIARLVLLPDGDRRGDAVDQVHIRLLNALQKLPGIG